jgi:hypothetical protein
MLSGDFGRVRADVPGQQFLYAGDGLAGDARQHFAQIGFGIEAVEFRRVDQAVDASVERSTSTP